uniref:Uncharacterized protein n=1 Tax=viral metagenome TaxID=1070528 RepID=A0A6H1ZXQ2_9ZZZZ
MYLSQTTEDSGQTANGGQIAEDSILKKAGAGIINSLILIGAIVGFYLMSKKGSSKQYKPGYSKRRHSKGKVLPLP